MYDWANSAMVTTVVAAVFPIFYYNVAGAAYGLGETVVSGEGGGVSDGAPADPMAAITEADARAQLRPLDPVDFHALGGERIRVYAGAGVYFSQHASLVGVRGRRWGRLVVPSPLELTSGHGPIAEGRALRDVLVPLRLPRELADVPPAARLVLHLLGAEGGDTVGEVPAEDHHVGPQVAQQVGGDVGAQRAPPPPAAEGGPHQVVLAHLHPEAARHGTPLVSGPSHPQV